MWNFCKGSQVRTLCEVIIAHNANSDNKVSINNKSDATGISDIRNSIKTNQNYSVTQHINKSTGLIESITVE